MGTEASEDGVIWDAMLPADLPAGLTMGETEAAEIGVYVADALGEGGEGGEGGAGGSGGAGARRSNSVRIFGRATGRGRQVTNFARENFALSRSRAAFSRCDAREHAGVSPIA